MCDLMCNHSRSLLVQSNTGVENSKAGLPCSVVFTTIDSESGAMFYENTNGTMKVALIRLTTLSSMFL